MAETVEAYEKDKSFVGMSQRTPDREAVYGRIDRLWHHLDDLSLSEHQRRVVGLACQQIFGQTAGVDESHFYLQDYIV